MSDKIEDIKKEDTKGNGHAAIEWFQEQIMHSEKWIQRCQGEETSLLHAIEGLKKCKMSDKKEDDKGSKHLGMELLQQRLTEIQSSIQDQQENKKRRLEIIEDIRKNC